MGEDVCTGGVEDDRDTGRTAQAEGHMILMKRVEKVETERLK